MGQVGAKFCFCFGFDKEEKRRLAQNAAAEAEATAARFRDRERLLDEKIKLEVAVKAKERAILFESKQLAKLRATICERERICRDEEARSLQTAYNVKIAEVRFVILSLFSDFHHCLFIRYIHFPHVLHT